MALFSSLTFGNPVSQLVFLLRGNNTTVGIVQGLKGLVQLLITFPVAVISDRLGRQCLLRLASIVGVVCLIFQFVLLLFLRTDLSHASFCWTLMASGCAWGIFLGIHSAPLAALFGECTVTGSRSKYYVWRNSLRTGGRALGSVTCAVVFLLSDDEWHEQQLIVIMCIGTGGLLLPVLLLWAVKDAPDDREGNHRPRKSLKSPLKACSASNADSWWRKPEIIAPVIVVCIA